MGQEQPWRPQVQQVGSAVCPSRRASHRAWREMDQASPAVARALLACSATFELGLRVQGHTAQCVTDKPYGDLVQPELHRESKPAWAIDDAANKEEEGEMRPWAYLLLPGAHGLDPHFSPSKVGVKV